jgi:hypothetical protein
MNTSTTLLARSLFLITLCSGLLSAIPSAATATATTGSAVTRTRIRSGLPDYSPAEHAKAETAQATATADDPDVIVLPAVTIQASLFRWIEEDSLFWRCAFYTELVKRELTTFDRSFLNRSTLPLFGVSKEARVRQACLERKNREFGRHVTDLARIVQLSDPQEAATLRASLRQWR